jgi:hypothetical protein
MTEYEGEKRVQYEKHSIGRAIDFLVAIVSQYSTQ